MNNSERAYEAVRELIVGGEIPAGSRINESELATRLGMSRTPVRDAVRRLCAEHLLEKEANRGARVPVWTEQSIANLLELRAQLEGFAASKAAAAISRDGLSRLREISSEMSHHLTRTSAWVDPNRLADLNAEFHRVIARASDNTFLANVLDGLFDAYTMSRVYQEYSEHQLSRNVEEHDELILALTQGDGRWAESVMTAHLLGARAFMLSDRLSRQSGGSDGYS